MMLLTLTIAFAFMSGVLLYAEQRDSTAHIQSIGGGVLAFGLMVRITLLIVMLVLMAFSLTTLGQPA